MEKALEKFCMKHFNFESEDLILLRGGIFTKICDEYDLDGISEYDLIEIIDSELCEAMA